MNQKAKVFRPSRIYVFIVVAMAVLLATLAFEHPRGGESVVEAKMTFTRFDNRSDQPVTSPTAITEVIEEIRSPQAIEQVLANLPEALRSEHQLARKGAAKLLAERVFVRTTPDPDQSNHDIVVRYIGDSSSFGLKLIEQITARFAAQHNNAADAEQAAKRCSATQAQVDQLGSLIGELETQLENYVAAELEAARVQHVSTHASRETGSTEVGSAHGPTLGAVSAPSPQPSSAIAPTSGTTSINMPVVEELNENWVNLRDELADIDQELSELRVNFTSQHPDVRRLESLADELQQRLAKTPQFVPQGSGGGFAAPAQSVANSHAANAPPPSQDSGLPTVEDAKPDEMAQTIQNDTVEPTFSASAPGNDEQGADTTMQAEFDAEAERNRILNTPIAARLVEQIARAKQERQQATLTLATVQNKVPDFRETTLLVGQPSLIRRYTDELQPTRLWSFLGLALSAGLGVALLRGKAVLPETIYSAADAEKVTQTTTLGAISTTDGPAIEFPKAGPLPMLARWAVRASEMTLFAAAIVVLAAACSVPDFGSQFFDNPFAAFAMAVDRVSSLV